MPALATAKKAKTAARIIRLRPQSPAMYSAAVAAGVRLPAKTFIGSTPVITHVPTA